MKTINIYLIIVNFTLLFQSSTFAQSESCATEPSLGGGDVLGYNVSPTPLTDDFAMTGTGCVDFPGTFFPGVCGSNAGFDNVVCFTPSNNCDVLIQTSTGSLGSSVNVFSGMCQEPSSCLVSAVSTAPNNNTVLISPFSLTAGTQYCVVWERCGSASQGLTINQINGSNCGALPVELLEYSVTSVFEETPKTTDYDKNYQELFLK